MVYFSLFICSLFAFILLLLCTFLRQSDKYGRKHGEYYAWMKATNQFKRIHKNVEQYGSYRQCTVERRSHACRDKDQASQYQHRHVSRQHIGERRIIKANGFVKIPKNSMKGIIGTGTFSHQGTSGQKISFQ